MDKEYKEKQFGLYMKMNKGSLELNITASRSCIRHYTELKAQLEEYKENPSLLDVHIEKYTKDLENQEQLLRLKLLALQWAKK